MKQLGLDPGIGTLRINTVPQPIVTFGLVLVRVRKSVVSTGTEMGKVSLASKPLWNKARERPDQVVKVLDAVRTEGLLATVQKVRERLATPQPLGYSLAGTVLEVGEGCDEFAVGMPVACAGSTASHAEYVLVPKNLAVRVPAGVRLDDAAFATIGALAMHGLRTGGVSL